MSKLSISSQDLYKELKRRVVTLEYAPGLALPVRAVAQEFGVSVTPVREALIRLESDGFVTRTPNRHVQVAEIRFKDIKESFEIRLLLLDLVGSLAAKRVSDDEISQLKELVVSVQDKHETSDLLDLDSAFHNMLNALTGNDTLVQIMKSLRHRKGGSGHSVILMNPRKASKRILSRLLQLLSGRIKVQLWNR